MRFQAKMGQLADGLQLRYAAAGYRTGDDYRWRKCTRKPPRRRRNNMIGRGRTIHRGSGMTERGQRKERVGTVISDKMQKTVVVSVERISYMQRMVVLSGKTPGMSPMTKKTIAPSATWYGSVETRPLSKTKRWRVAEIRRTRENILLTAINCLSEGRGYHDPGTDTS